MRKATLISVAALVLVASAAGHTRSPPVG